MSENNTISPGINAWVPGFGERVGEGEVGDILATGEQVAIRITKPDGTSTTMLLSPSDALTLSGGLWGLANRININKIGEAIKGE